MIENRGNQFQQKNIFLLVETIFDFFANASFRVVETDFLASTDHKHFFASSGNVFFLTNPSFQLLEKDLLFIGNRLLYLRVLSY